MSWPPDVTPPGLEPPPGMTLLKITLSATGGRELMIGCPLDLTRAERLELIEWIAGAMTQHLAEPSPFVIHRGPLPPT